VAAHRIAALAYIDTGDLDAADRHAALCMVSPSTSSAGSADLTVTAATKANVSADLIRTSIQFLRGDMQAVERMESLAFGPGGVALSTSAAANLASCYEMTGEYGKGLDAIERARQATTPSEKPETRRLRALSALTAARLIAAGVSGGAFPRSDLAKVEPLLAEARRLFQNDPRTMDCDMVEARVCALEGKADQALALIAAIEERRAAHYPGSRSFLASSLGYYGRVAEELGQHERAAGYWQSAASCCNPVQRPHALWHAGVCREALGDRAGARDAYQQAVATGIETHATAKARARLAESSP
jgi:tetratricopeptide (TPR) repeat protein